MKTSVLTAGASKTSPGFFLLLLVVSSTINGINCKKNKRSDLGGTSDGSWKLVKVEPKEIRTLSDLTDGVYAVQISGGRSQSCGLGSGELIGFNNRTCSVSLSPTTTAGPVMRQVSKSEMWREWMIRVEKDGDGVEKRVTLQAFIDPDIGKKARCTGYMSSFYGNPAYPNACSTPPYGTGVFLNGTKDSAASSSSSGPQIWSVRAVAGKENQGDFELLASSKPEESCARVLSLDGCEGRPTLSMMESSQNNEGSQTFSSWKLIKQYEMVSTAPPPSSPSPTPSALPSGPPFIPGPVISGPSATSSGYVDVTIKDIGGGNGCSVASIVLTSTGGALGSVVATVEVRVSSAFSQGVQVPIKADGYNSIYAFGVCSSGGNTEMSNGLAVFSSSPGVAAPIYDPVTIQVAFYDSYSPQAPFSDADGKTLCTNLITTFVGVDCEVVNSYLATYPQRRRHLSAGTQEIYWALITLTAALSDSSIAEIQNAAVNDALDQYNDALVSGLGVDPSNVEYDAFLLGNVPQIPVVNTIKLFDVSWTGEYASSWSEDAVYEASCAPGYFFAFGMSDLTTNTSITVGNLIDGADYYCSVTAGYEMLPGFGFGYMTLLSNILEITTPV